MSPETLLLVFLAFGLGGVLKGATGAGAPFLAVPIMSILVDVPFAVAVFLLPNLASNGWQVFRYRRDFPGRGFALSFALAAMAGAAHQIGAAIDFRACRRVWFEGLAVDIEKLPQA